MKKKSESKKSQTQINKTLAATIRYILLKEFPHDHLAVKVKRGLNLPDDLSLKEMRSSEDLLKVCRINGTATITIKVNGGAKNVLIKATE
jgi:hypothetical protein